MQEVIDVVEELLVVIVFNAKYDQEGLTSPFELELQAWRDRPNSSMAPRVGAGGVGEDMDCAVAGFDNNADADADARESNDADADAGAGEGSDDEEDGRFQWMIDEEAEVEAEEEAASVAKEASIDRSHSTSCAEDDGQFYKVLAAAFGNHQSSTSHLCRPFLKPAAVGFVGDGNGDGSSDADMRRVAGDDGAVGRVRRRRHLGKGAADISHGGSSGNKRIYGLVSGGAHAFAYGTTVADGTSGGGRNNEPVWEVEMDVVGWAPYDPTASSIIEMYYEVYLGPEVYHAERHAVANQPANKSTETMTFAVDTNGFTYTIDFESMTQTNCATKRTRAIRRSLDSAAGTTAAGDNGDGEASQRMLGFQRTIEEVTEWAGYPSRQCPHPGCQGEPASLRQCYLDLHAQYQYLLNTPINYPPVRMSVALMDFHEVLCDKQNSQEVDHGQPGGTADEHSDIIVAPTPETSADIATAAAAAAAAAPGEEVGPGGTNAEAGVAMEAAVAAATASAVDVVADAVADEMVVDVLGELLMGLHSNLFGADESDANTDEADATLPVPKFKSVKKRVGGGFIYVQVPDDGTDDNGAGTGETAKAAMMSKVGGGGDSDGGGGGGGQVGGGRGGGGGGGGGGEGQPFAKLPRRASLGKGDANLARPEGAEEKGNGARLPRLKATRTIPTAAQPRRSRRSSGSAGEGGGALKAVRSLRAGR